MGSVYAHHVQQVETPIVGIMSNGEEDEKGNELTKKTSALIREYVNSSNASSTGLAMWRDTTFL